MFEAHSPATSARPLVTATALLVGTSGLALAQNDDQLARGEFLAIAGNCAACHTADPDAPYAGGVPLDTPFGLLYSPNITPHATGIGDYTREAFVASIRQGINADGEPMYPAHPYPFYTKMTDEDVDALWAFIQTVEPVENEVDVIQLDFPFNVRTGLNAWRAAAFEEQSFVPRDDKSEEWNRGAYLVQAVTHCGACHTPRDITFAIDESRHLEGAEIRGWYAPDISAGDDSAIDDWSTEDLVKYLREGETTKLETSYGPMDDVVYRSLALIPEDAVRAIVTYVEDVAPEQPKEVDVILSSDEARIGNGEQLFVTNCSNCHLLSGEGMAGVAPTLDGNASITTAPANNVVMSLLSGLPPDPNWGGMPSFANILDNTEIAEVTNYVRTAWSNTAPVNATPSLVDELRREVRDVPGYEPWDAMCANLPRSQVDEEYINTVGEASAEGFTDDEVQGLIETYAKRFPDVDAGTALIAIGTGYCRHLALSDMNRDDALRQIGQFNSRLAAAIGTEMPDVETSEN